MLESIANIRQRQKIHSNEDEHSEIIKDTEKLIKDIK